MTQLTRDTGLFPSDKTGDALWQMLQSGDQLQQAREIEFAIGFPSEEQAMQFAGFLLSQRQKIMLRDEPECESHPIEVLIWVDMVPTHQEISGFEGLLLQHAEQLAGKSSGWGCYGVNQTA